MLALQARLLCWCTRVSISLCVCVCVLVFQVAVVLSCMEKCAAGCVCGLRQAWGKPVSTGDIISRKNTQIRNRPSHSTHSIHTLCPLSSTLPVHTSVLTLLQQAFLHFTPDVSFFFLEQMFQRLCKRISHVIIICIS